MDDSSSAFELGRMVGMMLGCGAFVILPILFIVSLIFSFTKRTPIWISICVITGLLGLCGVGLIAFGAYQEISESQTPAEIVCDDQLVKLTTVPGWSDIGLSLGSEDASLQVGNLLKSEFLIVVNDPKIDLEESTTVEDYAELAMAGSLATLKNGKVESRKQTTVAGMPALECEITGAIDGTQLNYLNTYIEGTDHFYQVVAWTLPSKRRAAFPAIRTVTASLREVGE